LTIVCVNYTLFRKLYSKSVNPDAILVNTAFFVYTMQSTCPVFIYQLSHEPYWIKSRYSW